MGRSVLPVNHVVELGTDFSISHRGPLEKKVTNYFFFRFLGWAWGEVCNHSCCKGSLSERGL